MHAVAFRGNRAAGVVATLLSAGANSRAGNCVGRTPLMNASLGNASELIALLLSAAPGGDVTGMLAQGDCNSQTALHHAAKMNAGNALNTLIESLGSDAVARSRLLDARDMDGFTALGCSASLGNLEAVKILLGAGASTAPGQPDPESEIELPGWVMAPAELALEGGHEAVAMVLLEAASTPLVAIDDDGGSAGGMEGGLIAGGGGNDEAGGKVVEAPAPTSTAGDATPGVSASASAAVPQASKVNLAQ